MRVLVTGTAGFIGSAVAMALLKRGDEVIGLDNLNSYYDVQLKLSRLERLRKNSNFTNVEDDLENKSAIEHLFQTYKPERVVNLAAQAGVRYSLENPHSYVDSNVSGFLNIIENCRHQGIEHLVYASTSSVYGANTNMPFSVHESTEHQVSLYAATKKANEMMAHTYSHLFEIPTTGLRFFTVYGPWGRPDMALFKFTKKILAGDPIDVFNHGNHKRDFTFIDDIVSGVIGTLDRPAEANSQWDSQQPDSATSLAPYKIYNIGNGRPVELLQCIELLEERLGRTTEKNMLPMQLGDVPETHADISDLQRDVGYKPNTDIAEGIGRFVDWYLEYYEQKV
ncbi:MAG: NAD-dependent epimerase [Pseudomonadota bacterium]